MSAHHHGIRSGIRSGIRPRMVVGAVVVVVAVLVTACGVPTDNSARRLDDDEVPFRLTATTVPAPTTTTPSMPVTAGKAVLLYFVVDGRLRAVPVPVDPTPELIGIMDLLAEGPPEGSANRTVVQPGEVLSVAEDPDQEGVIVVEVDPTLLQLPASEQVLAIGQIVLTLTDRPGIRAVLFTSGGSPVAVARPDGSIIEGPARRVDLIDLIG